MKVDRTVRITQSSSRDVKAERAAQGVRCWPCDGEDDDENEGEPNDYEEESNEEDEEEEPPCCWHWDDLTEAQKELAETLDYDEDAWFNDDGRAITWAQLMKRPRERLAALMLGFTEDTWRVDPEVLAAETQQTFSPRLDAAATLKSIIYLLDNHQDEWLNPVEDRKWWTNWAETHPAKLDDVLDKPKWESGPRSPNSMNATNKRHALT